MCEPTLLISAALGGAQAISGISEQNRAHRAQVAAVDRSNSMARTKYLNDIQISAYNDQRKGEIFSAKLKADAASRTAYAKQRDINQQEANRASESVQQELAEKINEAQFESQANMAKAIQAQGSVLASGQQAGQSMMLDLMQAEREAGFEQAQINATVYDATRAYGIKQYGVAMDQYSADVAAGNSIQTSASIAPGASFMTTKPVKQAHPEKPSALGPILSGVTTTIGMGSAIGGDTFWKDKLGDWFPPKTK